MRLFKRILKTGFVVILVVLVAIQFIPADRTNPASSAPMTGPPDVVAVLKKACWDCHSNETTWPWYAKVAPVSWQIAEEVHEGREEVNFSTWGEYSAAKQAHKIEEIWEEVESGKMPPSAYLLLHSAAELSNEDRSVLRKWAAAHAKHEDHDDR